MKNFIVAFVLLSSGFNLSLFSTNPCETPQNYDVFNTLVDEVFSDLKASTTTLVTDDVFRQFEQNCRNQLSKGLAYTPHLADQKAILLNQIASYAGTLAAEKYKKIKEEFTLKSMATALFKSDSMKKNEAEMAEISSLLEIATHAVQLK